MGGRERWRNSHKRFMVTVCRENTERFTKKEVEVVTVPESNKQTHRYVTWKEERSRGIYTRVSWVLSEVKTCRGSTNTEV